MKTAWYWESGDPSSSHALAGITPFSHPHHLCRQLPGLLTIRLVWMENLKEGGGAREGRPEQKVRTGREFKEMLLHTAAVNGSIQAPSRVEWDREPEVGIETGWRQPIVAAWESWHWDR